MNRTEAEADRILLSIPRHLLPRFIFWATHGTKKSIHRELRALVRDSQRVPVSSVFEGRVAKVLAKKLGINKNKRRIGKNGLR